jgi:serine/threonine protein kinase
MVIKGMRVGKYELGRTLGEGNSAKVKFAIDTLTGESFAIKIIEKSCITRLNVSFQVSIFDLYFSFWLTVDFNSYLLLIFFCDFYRLRERFEHSKF